MIGLIDYRMGNLLSVRRALEAAGGTVKLIDVPADMAGCDGILLPGVGNFGDGMEQLTARGFDRAIRDWWAQDRPFLGICLGMQLLFDASEEAPGVPGLGVIPGRVVRFPDGAAKVPHMGWNQVSGLVPHPVTAGTAEGSYFYFVHSFYVCPDDPAWVTGSCDYILPFAAMVGRGRRFATQFHPEKSQEAGMRLLKNFVALAEGQA